jgi:methylmalonyl-CoA mutase N-terminal domain/subunit
MERTSESGFPIDPVYDASKLTDFQPEAKLGRPGEYSFTRGAYPLAAVLGGTRSLPANSCDEALGLLSTKAARLAVRAQRVPMGPIGEMGGAAAAVESAACHVAREIDEGAVVSWA